MVEPSEVLDALNVAISLTGGVAALAKKWKFSPAYIYMVKNGDVQPSLKMLKRLGFDRQKLIVRA